MQAPCPTMQGFTAIELMVVVSIIAVLAALAGPSFTQMIESWRVRDATESLSSTLFLLAPKPSSAAVGSSYRRFRTTLTVAQ